MSEKRYPTRMHEVLGVEMNEEFYSEDKMLLRVNHHGRIERKTDTHPCGWDLMCNTRRVEDCINHGITRRPRLTEEQVAMLKAAWALGARYIAREGNGGLRLSDNAPLVLMGGRLKITDDSLTMYIESYGNPLVGLVKQSDPAPLDIVQTLRDAGVEVDDD